MERKRFFCKRIRTHHQQQTAQAPIKPNRPYGWPELEVILLLARLYMAGEVQFVSGGRVIDLNAKDALTFHLARSEGHECYFGCNLMHCKALASSHQHLMAEASDESSQSSPQSDLLYSRRSCSS